VKGQTSGKTDLSVRAAGVLSEPSWHEMSRANNRKEVWILLKKSKGSCAKRTAALNR